MSKVYQLSDFSPSVFLFLRINTIDRSASPAPTKRSEMIMGFIGKAFAEGDDSLDALVSTPKPKTSASGVGEVV